jgi:hypothetical protein
MVLSSRGFRLMSSDPFARLKATQREAWASDLEFQDDVMDVPALSLSHARRWHR